MPPESMIELNRRTTPPQINRSLMLSRFGTVSRVTQVNEEDRSFEHVISSESVDSHGSIIKLAGWDLARFKANPVVFFGHDSRSLPIGQSMRVWKDRSDKTLLSRTRFSGDDEAHALAETMFKLATAKPTPFLRGWSVGFMPRKWHEREDIDADERDKLWDPNVYTDQELWEYSLVPLPSNTDAITAARSAGIDVVPFVTWIAKDEDLVKEFCDAGICLPGVNDGIQLRESALDRAIKEGNLLQLNKGLSMKVEDGEVLITDKGEVRPHPERIAEMIKRSFEDLGLTEEERREVLDICSRVEPREKKENLKGNDLDEDEVDVKAILDELNLFIIEESLEDL